MNIGITTFGGDGGKSGISQYIINLLREFSLMEGSFSFEILTYESEKKIFAPGNENLSFKFINEGNKKPILNIAWHQFFLSGWCKRQKHDVLFLPAGNRRLPVHCHCPTVGTVHDFSSIHVPGKYDPARMFYITRVLPFLIKRLSEVLTVSESSKKDIVEYAQIPEEKVTVTHLAANNEIYFPRDKEKCQTQISQKYGICPPYILNISRIEHPGKNHVRLIRAFELLKTKEKIPHQLVIAGSDWNGAEEVHRAAERCKFSKDIVFTGFTATEDLPILYGGSDLFVFPSLYEGFGLPVLEAMSCGIPVACSNLSSMPEVAGSAAKLFDPYEEASIEESMEELLTDRSKLGQYARLGIERSKDFSWKKTAQMTLKAIQKATAGV